MGGRRSAGLAGCCAPALAVALMALLATGAARPQTPACEQLKSELATRIDASGARGYALEAVRAGTPMPAGAKVIGSCESGRYKVLYRRWAAAASTDVPETPARDKLAAAPPDASKTAPSAPRQKPNTAVPAARPPAVAPPAAAQPPAPLPPSAATGETSAAPPPTAGRTSGDTAIGVRASAVLVARIDVPAAQAAAPAPSSETVVAQPSWARRAIDLARGHWPWLLVLALLPLAGWLYSRWAYHRASDEAGLPRGPRL